MTEMGEKLRKKNLVEIQCIETERGTEKKRIDIKIKRERKKALEG